MTAPLYGLVLTGGRSSRMGRDKAALAYGGKPQSDAAFELLEKLCEKVFVSSRRDQAELPGRAGRPQIHDLIEDLGPAGGILSALKTYPEAAWLILACDLPFISEPVLRSLITQRDPSRVATSYRSAHDALPEPVCAIYEPTFLPRLEAFLAEGIKCPRKMLIRSEALLLELPDAGALENVNQPGEFEAARARLATKTIRLRYYAVLRERLGRDEETRSTSAATPAQLFTEIASEARLSLPVHSIRAAINGQFAGMSSPLSENDEVVFVPPVAGG